MEYGQFSSNLGVESGGDDMVMGALHVGMLCVDALCVSGSICLPEARDAEGAVLSLPNLVLCDLRTSSCGEWSRVSGAKASNLNRIYGGRGRATW